MKASRKARARCLLSHVRRNMHFVVLLILLVVFFASICLVVLKLIWIVASMIIRKPREISANSHSPILLQSVDQSRD
jgi:hypothetical protein